MYLANQVISSHRVSLGKIEKELCCTLDIETEWYKNRLKLTAYLKDILSARILI